MKNKKAQALREKADLAKMHMMAGIILYEEAVQICGEYIDYCNERAVDMAKKYGMKPKKMNVKAFMR